MNNHDYCIIMAGGIGSRFWPLSRSAMPKQFLDILGVGETLLQQTFNRFLSIVPLENIYIVSNSEYVEIITRQLPSIILENILLEPLRRNTAPCIAYATQRIMKKDPLARMVVAPSDHLIMKEEAFQSVVKEGLHFVGEHEALLTIGIKPSRPETGYGYIQVNSEHIKSGNSIIKMVKTFTEKPDLKLAQVFVDSGEFVWNAGIFFWSVQTINNAFNDYLPEVYAAFNDGQAIYETPGEKEFIEKTYSACKNISIDYGVMEKAENVYVLIADFGWSDLGTWGSLYEQVDKDEEGNAVMGKSIYLYDVKDSLINVPEGKLVVIQGLENCIVVDSGDVLLISKKEEEQRIKNFVNDVKIGKGEKYI